MGSRIRLHRVLFIALATVFVALLIELSGEFHLLWPFYCVPIFVAALTFHAPGAILMTATVGAIVGFNVLDANVSVTDAGVAEAAVGVGAFFISAMIVGVLTQRQELRSMELERISVFDPLTGLYSSTYFTTRLEEEIRRRSRYGGEITLLLIELEDFKEFKETFGTRRGDLLLEHMAEVMKIAVRNTDVLAYRHEGTFGLICPHCPQSDAATVARRLSELVEKTEFEGDELEPVTMHTVRIGASTCPDSALDAEELLALAESGLRASESGHATPASPAEGSQAGEA